MNRLRHKLILLFLAATLIPTAAILWTSAALLDHSLSYAATEDLDQLSKSLEAIAREFYRQSCEDLKRESASGSLRHRAFEAHAMAQAPAPVREFWRSGEADRFVLAGLQRDRLEYLVRSEGAVLVYARPLQGIRMEALTRQYRHARALVANMRQRDLRKGFTRTLMLLSAGIWILALAGVAYVANRISRPIQDLTAGLHRLAGGEFRTRLYAPRSDEIGRAIQAFNHTAVQLQQNRERVVYLTQMASWQSLARKMAHELKNSLTPIRLTVEEIQARGPGGAREFLDSAARVVIEEVESLERRVRAFSEFASEPAVRPESLDLNALLDERVQFLEIAHPEVAYQIEKSDDLPAVRADSDQIKGILTNLLENAADAAGPGGRVQARTCQAPAGVMLEVHDSGPGVSEDARRSLFEPAISFKKHGMGLGLSISRKNALMAGGDLQLIPGVLGGAGFRLTLPLAVLPETVSRCEAYGSQKDTDCR